ncbi:MAG: DUF937 domain-containing protein [Hyphomicrobium sp.]|nr:MAG: DUF937 domain-containing protein [Hyphomicrobium sp.]PPC98489.1 MAG: DUF937 domain-containing protein [Hyphomicrobium sp.]
MDIDSVIKNSQGGSAITNLASAFGVSPDKAAIAFQSLSDALTYRIQRNGLSRGGIADIVALLGEPDAGRALSDPQHMASADIASNGNHVLDVLIGDKHTSRGIAQRTARASGLDESVVKKMLPVVASMMVGALQSQTSNILAQKFQGDPKLRALLPLPGDPPVRDQTSVPQIDRDPIGREQDYPRSSGSGGGMGGTTGGGGVLLPLPGERSSPAPRRNRYDDLSDVIRRGGTPAPGGGSLANMIRSILAGLLGFKNRGVIGSIVYMFLARWVMGVVRRLLSRVLTGR